MALAIDSEKKPGETISMFNSLGKLIAMVLTEITGNLDVKPTLLIVHNHDYEVPPAVYHQLTNWVERPSALRFSKQLEPHYL